MILSIAMVAVVQAHGPSAEQFSRIVNEQHLAVRDVSFLFEGEHNYNGSLPDGVSSPLITTFQAWCVVGSEGTAYVDCYNRKSGESSYTRQQSSLVGDRLKRHTDSPDRYPQPMNVQEEAGSGGSLNHDGSPHRFVWFWFFRENPDLTAHGYRWLGSEKIEDRDCDGIAVSMAPDLGMDNRFEFWMDLERGAHPLRIDMYHAGKLILRTHHIRLAKFKAIDRQEVWLPVHAEVDGFDGLADTPISNSVYDIVAGSVTINGGTVAKDFEIQAVGEQARTAAFRPIQARMDERRGRARQKLETVRSDPKSVRAALDSALIEARAQESLLTASSPGQRRINGAAAARWTLTALGVGLAGSALVLARRNAA